MSQELRASGDPKEIRVKVAHGVSEGSLARRAEMVPLVSREREGWQALKGSRACQVSLECWDARAIRETQDPQDLRAALAHQGPRAQLVPRVIQENLAPASVACLAPRATWDCQDPLVPPAQGAHQVSLGCQDKWGRVGSRACRAGMVCQGRTARQEGLGRWVYQDLRGLLVPRESQGMLEPQGRPSLDPLEPRERRVSRHCWRVCCWESPAPRVIEACQAPRVRRGSQEGLESREILGKTEPRDPLGPRGRREHRVSVHGDHQDRMGLQV